MKKNKIVLLSFLGIFLLILLSLSPIRNSDFNFNSENLKNSKISGKIQIIGNSGWITAKAAGTCTGSGTSNDPYIIEDLVINAGGSENCISIANSDVHFRIENCTAYNSGTGPYYSGIKLYSVSNGVIINNYVHNNDHGIYLENSNTNIITNNTSNDNYWDGIFFLYSNFNNASENSVDNAIYGSGIGSYYSHSNTICENIVTNTGWGISFEFSYNNIISGNNASYNDNFGIHLKGGYNNTVLGNVANFNDVGIKLEENSYENIILGNNASENSADGLGLENCNYNTISNNSANSNGDDGIDIYYSNYNTITGNFASNNYWDGIYLFYSDYNTIVENVAQDNSLAGINLWEGNGNTISENTVKYNERGISLEDSRRNTIVENTISNNNYGIFGSGSTCNNLINNAYSNNGIDISGDPDYCNDPLPFDPFTIENILIIGMIIGIIIVSTIFLMLIFKRNRRPSRQIIISTEKTREEFKIIEKPVREKGLKPEIKSKLIISPDLKKLDAIQEDVILSSPEKKQEEIIEKEQVIEEIRVPPEKIVEEEEKIVKDTIEVPKFEIKSCQFCGMELSSDVIFCLRCGHKLNK